VPVVFHSNPTGHDPDFHGSAPSRIYRAVYGRDLAYVIAHMGGVSFFKVFATDYPVYPYEAYYEILDRLALSDEETSKIAYANAKRMLSGLPPGSSIG